VEQHLARPAEREIAGPIVHDGLHVVAVDRLAVGADRELPLAVLGAHDVLHLDLDVLSAVGASLLVDQAEHVPELVADHGDVLGVSQHHLRILAGAVSDMARDRRAPADDLQDRPVVRSRFLEAHHLAGFRRPLVHRLQHAIASRRPDGRRDRVRHASVRPDPILAGLGLGLGEPRGGEARTALARAERVVREAGPVQPIVRRRLRVRFGAAASGSDDQTECAPETRDSHGARAYALRVPAPSIEKDPVLRRSVRPSVTRRASAWAAGAADARRMGYTPAAALI
jgi:hypothetical protein